MGEISEMIQDGILCDRCGAFVGEEKLKSLGIKFDGDTILDVPGYPITCSDCKKSAKRKKYGKKKPSQPLHNSRGDIEIFLILVVAVIGILFLLSQVSHYHHKKKAYKLHSGQLAFPPAHPNEEWYVYAIDGGSGEAPRSGGGGSWSRGPAPKQDEVEEEQDTAIDEHMEAPEGMEADAASADSGSDGGSDSGGGDGGGGDGGGD